MPKTLAWTLTFLVVLVCWVFFCAENFSAALAILRAMTDVHCLALPEGGSWEQHFGFLQTYGVPFVNFYIRQPFYKCFIVIGVLLTAVLLLPNPIVLLRQRFQTNVKWLIASSLLMLYALYKLNTYTEFLYFQF